MTRRIPHPKLVLDVAMREMALRYPTGGALSLLITARASRAEGKVSSRRSTKNNGRACPEGAPRAQDLLRCFKRGGGRRDIEKILFQRIVRYHTLFQLVVRPDSQPEGFGVQYLRFVDHRGCSFGIEHTANLWKRYQNRLQNGLLAHKTGFLAGHPSCVRRKMLHFDRYWPKMGKTRQKTYLHGHYLRPQGEMFMMPMRVKPN